MPHSRVWKMILAVGGSSTDNKSTSMWSFQNDGLNYLYDIWIDSQ